MDLHSMVLDLGQILCCKKKRFDSTKKFSKTDNIKMLAGLIDNLFAMYGRRVVQHIIVIPLIYKLDDFVDHICLTDPEIKDNTDTYTYRPAS